ALEKTQPDVIYKQFWHTVAYDLTAKAHLFMIDNQITCQDLKDLHQSKLQAEVKDYFLSKGLRLLSRELVFLKGDDQRLCSKNSGNLKRGSGEGFRVTLKVHNELTLEVHDVTSKVLDKPSDHSSGSNSDSEFVVKDISSDEADIIEKAKEAKKEEI
nr:hypothetical protein [Tanacetum cinerariifolium]GFB47748.1 hypothetical protein [Tanacetum cinerariifolium]